MLPKKKNKHTIRDDFTVNYQHQYVKCGKPSCSKCNKGKGHGPYWYAFWREGKKIRKRYIGKKFKALWELPPYNEELKEFGIISK